MLLFTLALIQATKEAPRVLPPLPPLVSAEYQATVTSIASRLEAGDFDGAKKQLRLLPRADFQLVWDDQKVPQKDRVDFIEARNNALRAWAQLAQGKTNIVKKSGKGFESPGDLRISFEPELAVDPILGSKARTLVFGPSRDGAPNLPRIDGRIALKRGNPFRPVDKKSVRNDVLNIVGSYFGLGRNVFYGGALTPIDPPVEGTSEITPAELVALRGNIRMAEILRRAVETKERVIYRAPQVSIEPVSFEGELMQGEKAEMILKFTNKGAGKLTYRVEGDCTCVVTTPPGVTAPGQTDQVKITIDTAAFDERVERKIAVYTNDPREPARFVPVSLLVKPLYRFISPEGRALLMPDNGLKTDVFLTFSEGNSFEISQATLNGLPGTVKVEKWKGSLADPDHGEPTRPRSGYRLHLEVPNSMVTPRSVLGLQIRTNSPEFPLINFPMTVQRGIIASPEELFMGELARTVKEATFVVVRPLKPFTITSATIDARSITVKVGPGRNPSEYKVTVRYDGTAPAGDLSATVTLKTNDPKQPEILVPVTGIIR